MNKEITDTARIDFLECHDWPKRAWHGDGRVWDGCFLTLREAIDERIVAHREPRLGIRPKQPSGKIVPTVQPNRKMNC